ncbi:MAG: Ig-like domain-containing protein, partial [Bacteroidales bacterium]|nr:Ig-like domain-containing protein [Bacteroidales bacterium]
ATVTPDNATDKTVTWESSDPSVATVVDGTVTAIADGFTTITATCGDCSAVCEVSVAAPAQPGSTTTTESEAMFNFNEPSTLSPVPDVSNNNASYSLDGVTFTSGSIELTGNGGSTTARVWDCSSSGHSTEYRLYNGATLTIKSADANALITKVEFTGYQLTAISANSSGDANSYTWTNTDGVSSVDFSIVTKGSYKRVDINTINVTYKVVTTTPGTEYETQFLGNINGAGWVLADLVNDQHTFTVSSTSYFTFTDDAAWSGAWRPESNANQTITLDATITAAQGTAGYFVLTNPGTYTVTVDNYGERTFTIERATGVTDVNADAAADAPAEYYNLNGIRVDAGDLQPGLYIRLQDTRATKVLVR